MTKEEQVYNEVMRGNPCAMITGSENTDELIELFFTPQGIEFCTEYQLPELDAFRRFKGMKKAEQGGFYIDTPVKAKNLPRVALIGSETVAELEYTETKGYTVVLMHGAKAKITASGYSVLSIENAGCEVEIIQKDNAKIFRRSNDN